MNEDDDPYFREFLRQTHESWARQSELADPNFRHTPACLEAGRVWKKDDAAWMARWPNFCRRCGGEGAFIGYDDAFGCEECSEKSLCARCGVPLHNGEWPCNGCGFEGDPERPQQPTCNCSGDGKTQRKKPLPF